MSEESKESKESRERNEKAVERFLNCNSKVLPLYLSKSEVKELEKKYPILITRGTRHGSIYECFAYKRKK